MTTTDRDPLLLQLERQRAAFRRDGAPSCEARGRALVRLRAALLAHGDGIVAAVNDDFGARSAHETRFLEIAPIVTAIDEALPQLAEWMAPVEAPTPAFLGTAISRVTPRPKGVVGIIVPWNYPVGLALMPLVAAVAAGNRVMLKPSANTPRTAAALGAALADAFDEDEVAVVSGGAGLGARFSSLPFDHLLFTGSTEVGREVMRAAAEHLVPVTLELGGKCPVIVAGDYPIDAAVGPIAWGKTLSAGQTCVAPDYALVPRAGVAEFVLRLRETLSRLFPAIAANPDYSAIINDREYRRVRQLVADAAARGATVIEVAPAGERPDSADSADSADRRIAPTLIVDPTAEMAVMQDEIFGPVLPIVPYDTLDDALAFVNGRPAPLALYLFSHDAAVKETVLARTTSGGVTINGVLGHMMQERLPFGGIGASGMGHYHGRWGFLTFSQLKASLDHGTGRRPIDRFSAPYGAFFDRVLETWLRPVPREDRKE